MNLLNSGKLELLRKKVLDSDESEINLGEVINLAKPTAFAERVKNNEVSHLYKKINTPICEKLYMLYYSKSYTDLIPN